MEVKEESVCGFLPYCQCKRLESLVLVYDMHIMLSPVSPALLGLDLVLLLVRLFFQGGVSIIAASLFICPSLSFF